MAEFGRAYSMPYQRKKALLARLAAEMLRNEKPTLKQRDALRLLPGALAEIGEPDLKPTSVLRALVARSGVLRGSSAERSGAEISELGLAASHPLPEAIEFIHNRFREWLASTYFLSSGTHGELARGAGPTDDAFDNACAFAAAAPDNRVFVTGLVKDLLRRSESTTERRLKRHLRVLAVRCALVAQALPERLSRPSRWTKQKHCLTLAIWR